MGGHIRQHNPLFAFHLARVFSLKREKRVGLFPREGKLSSRSMRKASLLLCFRRLPNRQYLMMSFANVEQTPTTTLSWGIWLFLWQ